MLENDDIYESLGEGVSVGVSLSAGAIAGIAEHCVMYPVDSVKTRMQALSCEKQLKGTGIFTNIIHIMKEEGLTRPVRGVQVMALGAGPAHALYFSCYEQLKTGLTRLSRGTAVPDSAVYGVAGGVATLFHDAIMTPAEAVKQRMQMCCSPYTNCRSCARTVFREEGVRAFYRSYTTQLTMNIPFQATHFIVYEFLQNLTNPSHEYNPRSHIVSGAVAGAVAATITMPLDVCKTLLNTQEPNLLRQLNQKRVVGLPGAARIVYAVAGLGGFFQGLKARVLYQMPSTAIAWSVYEGFKHVINNYNTAANIAAAAHPYDTLASEVRRERSSPGGGGGFAAAVGGGDDGGEKGADKLWEAFTDISRRQLHASESWSHHGGSSSNSSSLAFKDRTFASPIRTD